MSRRTERLRAIIKEMPSAPPDFDQDEEPTRPGNIPPLSPPRQQLPSLTEDRASNLLTQTLPLFPPHARLPALALLLAAALLAFYLWRSG